MQRSAFFGCLFISTLGEFCPSAFLAAYLSLPSANFVLLNRMPDECFALFSLVLTPSSLDFSEPIGQRDDCKHIVNRVSTASSNIQLKPNKGRLEKQGTSLGAYLGTEVQLLGWR